MNPTEFEPPVSESELSPEPLQDSTATRQRGLISSVLSPAVRLWLRAQLDHVEDLQFTVEAGDRQLLSGAIGRVSVSASKAVYRGLHLSQAEVIAENIRTNLRQVVRGKPLRLLEAFPLVGSVLLSETDLNTSLRSSLLAAGMAEFLLKLLQAGLDGQSQLTHLKARDVWLQDSQIRLGHGNLTLAATLLSAGMPPMPVILKTGFCLENGNQLRLDRPQRLTHFDDEAGTAIAALDGYTFDLGSSVCFETLTLEPTQLACKGQVMVMPEEKDEGKG